MNFLLKYLAPPSPFDAPSPLYALLDSPLSYVARSLHLLLIYFKPHPHPLFPSIRVVCISDTHTHMHDVPDGDLLIHAGDLTNAGTIAELQAQIDWLNSLPHACKVAIAGNHDTYLDPRSRRTLSAEDVDGDLNWGSVHYLQHESATLVFPERGGRRLKIYGAPQIPSCGGKEFAFQYSRGQDAWSGTVPKDVDILITHTPPKGYLDLPVGLGCSFLLKETWRVRPRLHVFGHVHAGNGTEYVRWDKGRLAYERMCARKDGLFWSLIRPRNWVDMVVMVAADMRSLLWTGLWGGEESGGVLVNAAMMSQSTGRLDNAPRMVLV